MTMFFLSFFALAAGDENCDPCDVFTIWNKCGFSNGRPSHCTDEKEIVGMDPDDIVEATNRCTEPCADENQKPKNGDVKYTAELNDGTRGLPGRGYCECNVDSEDVYKPIGKDFVRVCEGDDGLSFHREHAHECKNGWLTEQSNIHPENFGACHEGRKEHCVKNLCRLTKDDAETEEPCPVSRDNIIGNTHSCACEKKPNCSLVENSTDDITYECTPQELRRRSLRTA